MNLEQLNLIRKGNGQEPLTELPADLAGPKNDDDKGGGGDTPEQIEAKRKQRELDAEKEKNKNKTDMHGRSHYSGDNRR